MTRTRRPVRRAVGPTRVGVRAGVSLVEVLVALAIVLVLVGLLLPAVQKVREAASRVRCQNNLGQIGKAFLAYHDTRGHFPRGGGGLSDHCPANPAFRTPATREAEWNWAYAILPHLEQTALYREPDPAVVRGTPVRVFYCPSRREAIAYHGLAKIDYAGNAGTDPDGANGVVMRSSRGVVRLADVTDGLCNTVLVGGKRLNRAMLGASADDDDSYATAGWAGDYEVYRLADEPPAQDLNTPGLAAASARFGSPHPGVFNVVFGDGSVRPVGYTIDLAAWRKVCVRNDHGALNNNDHDADPDH